MNVKNNIISKVISIFTALMIAIPLSSVAASAFSSVKGDVNGDGIVTANDSMMALRYSVNAVSLTEEEKMRADVDNDGEVRISDAFAILRYSVGIKDAIPDDTNHVDPYIQEVVRLVNVERAKENLSPLEIDEQLNNVAEIRAYEIVSSFSHTRPNGSSCFTVLAENGVTYRTAGENIAAGYTTPEVVVQNWMQSQGHRENIMNPKFTKIGVGHLFLSDTKYGHYWTQMFTG